uniref:Uncharacterized protein n=1 Tax=Nelumbo nucifera TaxID=4432 RepID=A0A822Z6U4_NELNU|nr:TPA_asm: hypothetical protein HUJ06_007909 [Nelumbo nucifera]
MFQSLPTCSGMTSLVFLPLKDRWALSHGTNLGDRASHLTINLHLNTDQQAKKKKVLPSSFLCY